MGQFVLTGGAAGIGAAIRRQLQEQGHQVLVVDLQDADVEADLTSQEGRAQAVEQIVQRSTQGLDGFVPCAGLGPTAPPEKVLELNFFAAMEMVEQLRPQLARGKAPCVLITSNSAPMAERDQKLIQALLAGDRQRATEIVGADGQRAYAGAKLALAIWMRRQAPDYARKDGIRLNAVAPGITMTALTHKVFEDAELGQSIRDFADSLPVGKPAEPEEIASMVSFLLSPAGRYCCGGVFFVDGGSDAMMRPDRF